MAIVLDDTPRMSSVNASLSSVAGQVVTLSPRLTIEEGFPGAWQVPCIKMTGTVGLSSITVKVPNANARKSWVCPEETGYYSHDFVNWSDCSTATQDATFTTCTIPGTVAQDTTWFSRERMVGDSVVAAWLTRMDGEYSGLFRPVPGESSDYIVDTFSSQTNELGGTVPATPLYAAMLTNGNGRRKPRICVMSGVHAGENYATEVFLNMAEYILDGYIAGTTFARNILNRWDVLMIPYANAPGREGGHCRAQFEGSTSTNDMNRHFTTGTYQTVTLNKAFLTKQCAIGSTDLFIDYHTQYFAAATDGGIQGYYSGFGGLESSWVAKYQARASYTNYGGDPGGTVIGWFRTNRLVALGNVIEQNEQRPKTIADGQTIATYAPLVWNDMLVAGDFGSTQLATSRIFLGGRGR